MQIWSRQHMMVCFDKAFLCSPSNLLQYPMMVPLYSPRSPVEQAMLASILEAEGIEYFIRNDIFGSMEVGPRIPLFNAKTIMVSEEDAERAKELLSDYIRETGEEASELPGANSTFAYIRMVLEFLLFGWIMPGRRGKKREE